MNTQSLIPAPPRVLDEEAMCRGHRCIHARLGTRHLVLYYEPKERVAAFYDAAARRWTLLGPIDFPDLIRSFPERGLVVDEHALPGWIDACTDDPSAVH